MTTNQIYAIVNSINSQGAAISNITATDAQSFISLGNDILSSDSNTESFLNRMVQLIGLHIFSYREYRNKLKRMYKNDFEWGAIVQKVAVAMPEAETDESYNLVNGQSVDHWKVSKPEVFQKLFVTRTPYKFRMTRAYHQMQEAFRDEASFERFWAACAGELRNAIEFSIENLGRATIANYIAEVSGTAREIPLVTQFNTELGLTGQDALTAQTALHSDLFLNFAIGRINHHANMMGELTVRYNDGTKPRFTPEDKRVIRLLSDFDTRAQTVTQYAAYHDRFVSVGGEWDSIAYWQNSKVGEESKISVKRKSDGTTKNISNIIAVVNDVDALGLYKEKEWTLSTGWNADGSYITQVHHLIQLWFNDLSENFAFFTLN